MKPLPATARKLLERQADRYIAAFETEGPDGHWHQWLASRGFDPDVTGKRFRLGIVDRPAEAHKHYAGWLAVPNLLCDRWGNERVVGLAFRNPDPDAAAKYMYPKGQGIRMYNLRALREAADVIALCEGQSDTWSCDAAGVPVIGIPGAKTFGGENSYRLRLLEGFSRVILLQDNDEAGQGLANELESVDGLEVKTMPDGLKDVNEALRKLAPDKLREFILKQELSGEFDDDE